jgi:DNA-binding CsgD family transcriptional regulator
MATLYSPRSTADFPEHALSLLVKLIGLDRADRSELNARTNHPSSYPKIPSSLNIQPQDRCSKRKAVPTVERDKIDRSLLEPFLAKIVKSSNWIEQSQASTIEVARIVSESDTYYVEGRYWRFHDSIEFESSLIEPVSEQVNRLFVDPTHPTTTHAAYLFRSDLLTIAIDRNRQTDRNLTIDMLCEGDRYLLDFVYPHLFQAYQNSVLFTNNQQQLIEEDISHRRAFSVELAQSLGLTKREAEVLWSIAKDKSNSEIALSLECSLSTVKKHLEHIYEKLEVKTRTAAVMTALIRLGLISRSVMPPSS